MASLHLRRVQKHFQMYVAAFRFSSFSKQAGGPTVYVKKCHCWARFHRGSFPFLLPLTDFNGSNAEVAMLHTSSWMSAVEEKLQKEKPKSTKQHRSVLMQIVDKKEEPKELTIGGKVAQAGKDVSYIAVILFGFAVAGFLIWSVSSEFFRSDSPSTIFTKTLKRVKSDPRIIDALGEPITGHGEHSGRGRRRNIAHQEYVVDGVTYMRLKFYVDGSKRKGTVFLDLKKNDQSKYVCRFLFVELKGYPPATIIIEDNR